MHVLIPFASARSEAAVHVLRDLSLPSLSRLLQRLTPAARDDADESTLSPPHERALAQAWGWPVQDGLIPFAASAAAADGIDVGQSAWGMLTPAHWVAGRDRVTMTDPSTLAVDEAESRALFEATRSLFDSEGFTTAWGAPLRWYAAHPSLSALACASPDRVIGRSIDTWLQASAPVPLLRRLQSEAQLTFYTHPVNEAREARGDLPVNSFWISGCGVHRPATRPGIEQIQVLRAPLLAQDWAAWAEAWRALDAGPLGALLRRCEAGDAVALTLCGERCAQRFESQPRSIWQRIKGSWVTPPLNLVLEAL